MNVLKWYAKAMLTNRSIWSWGVGFMLFWLVIGAFVESQGQDLSGSGTVVYTASWFVVIVLFSLSMFAVAVANSLTYGSAALSYSFRFSNLTPRSFFGSVVGGSALVGTVLSFVMLGSTVAVFGAKFDTRFTPANLPALVGTSVGAGVFYMACSMTLMLVVINYLGLKSASFAGFLPLLLSYTFGLGQIYVQLPAWLVYGSPYNDIASLLYQGFTGHPAAIQLAGSGAEVLAWPYLAAGLVVWTLLLSTSAAWLLGRVRVRQIEEGRQI
ncbi:MAG TPA: hypothetical protein VMI55_07985 [Thermoplasmata archaeon]|nr:hypothetical protein [Thermoplasmata archaeon]